MFQGATGTWAQWLRVMKANLLTARALGELLEVHVSTVKKWERSGLPVAHRGRKGKPSLYDEVACRAWLAAREEAAKAPGAPLDVVQERAAKEHWQALLSRQMFEVRAKRLLPADEVEKEQGRLVGGVRTKLLGVPQAWAPRVHRAAVLEGEGGVERLLNEMVRDVLRELAGVSEAKPAPAMTRKRRKKAA